jgi:predicted component of type VI protein secretion system
VAFITFIANKRYGASYRLADGAVLGRSMECDVFVPDAFVSREHCAFEHTDAGWAIVDTGSSNGIWVRGQRVTRHQLQQDDIVEIGTIAIVFGTADLPENLSTPIPFGRPRSAMEMVETICAEAIRPADYVRQRRRRPAWERAEQVGVLDLLNEPLLDPLDFVLMEEPAEWTELDLEIQVAQSQDDLPTDPDPFALAVAALAAGFTYDAKTGTVSPPRPSAATAPRAANLSRARPKLRFGPTPVQRLGDAASGMGRLLTKLRYANPLDALGPVIARPFHATVALLLSVAFILGVRWMSFHATRPPVVLPDGQNNPAYFNGDEPG